MNALLLTLSALVPMPDPAPAADDVKAGWGAFGIFMLLAVAVALLGWSLVKHLRKAQTNAEAGAFGPVDDADGSDTADESAARAAGDDPAN